MRFLKRYGIFLILIGFGVWYFFLRSKNTGLNPDIVLGGLITVPNWLKAGEI